MSGRRRVFRKLHLRWWHASAHAMIKILQQAGLPQRILDEVHNIVDTCRVCRTWAKPLPSSIASVAVPTAFNEQVEGDIMFYKKFMILNLLDRTTRWHSGIQIEQKTSEAITAAIDSAWLMTHGAMKEFICDGERAIAECAQSADFFTRRGIKLQIRAPGQHARLVERRQALLRDMLHRIDTQLQADGVLHRIPLSQRLSEATFAGNALISINGATPYSAVYGRVPTILPDLNSALPDGVGHDAQTRDVNRVREASVQAIVEATSRARIQRALNTRTINAAEMKFELGMEVEYFREPSNKDTSGWSGPATIVSMDDVHRGTIRIRAKNKELVVAPRDLRPATTYLALLNAPHLCNPHDNAFQVVRQYISHLPDGSVELFGQTVQARRWVTTARSRTHTAVFNAIRFMAENTLGLQQVIAFACGRANSFVPGRSEYAHALLMTWQQETPDERYFTKARHARNGTCSRCTVHNFGTPSGYSFSPKPQQILQFQNFLLAESGWKIREICQKACSLWNCQIRTVEPDWKRSRKDRMKAPATVSQLKACWQRSILMTSW